MRLIKMVNQDEVRKILVIDDEKSIQGICQIILASDGFEVDVADNAKVAQHMVSTRPYDLLLVDIRTPEMTGIQFYWWLQNKYPHLIKRLLFTTGDVMEADTEIFLTTTGVRYLAKPFSIKELKKQVKEALMEADS